MPSRGRGRGRGRSQKNSSRLSPSSPTPAFMEALPATSTQSPTCSQPPFTQPSSTQPPSMQSSSAEESCSVRTNDLSVEDTDDLLSSKKRKRDDIEKGSNHFYVYGKNVCRTIGFDLSPIHVLRKGPGIEDSEWSTATTEQREQFRRYHELVEVFPELLDLSKDPHRRGNYELACRTVLAAIRQARQDDTASIKSGIVILLAFFGKKKQFHPYLAGKKLLTELDERGHVARGYKHIVTGELLCPLDLDYEDMWQKLDREEPLTTPDGQPFPISKTEFPRALFADEVLDDDQDFIKHFLMSPLLLAVYRWIMFGPDPNLIEPKKGCKAERSDVDEVTLGSIAYMATQLTSALHGMRWDHPHFYFSPSDFFASIMSILNDPAFEDDIEALLLWWNNQIYPKQNAPAKTVNAMEVKMRAQKRARLEAAAQAGTA